MPLSRILVVALDADVRRSIEFALEAEGYRATALDSLPSLDFLRQNRFGCTVLDQRALVGEARDSISFCITAHPVVLLAGQPHPWLTDWVSQIVITPDGQNGLTKAILAATRAAAPD